MPTITKLALTIPEARKLEDTVAQTAKQKADIDYIAMMTDVEIPTATTEEVNSNVSNVH